MTQYSSKNKRIPWKEVMLEDVCTVITDGAHKSPSSVEDGLPMASVKDMSRFGIDINSAREISKEDFRKLVDGNCQPKLGDVLLAKDGAKAAETASIVNKDPEYVLLSSIAILRPDRNKILPEFLWYYFDSDRTTRYLKKVFQSGAAITRIVLKDLKKAKIKLSPLAVQRNIVSLLKPFDDLIENNKQRLEILEEMAETVYKEWFVNFNCPGSEDVEMKSVKGNNMPFNWDYTNLETVLKKLEAGKRPKGGIDESVKEVPNVGASNVLGIGKFDFSNVKYVTKDFYESMNAGIVNDGDILLYKDGAKLGRRSLFKDHFPFENCSVNSHVLLLHTKKDWLQYYLYFWLGLSKIQHYIKNVNSSSAQPGINQTNVKNMPFLLPSTDVAKRFHFRISPLIDEIINLAKISQNLRQERDLLLPRLISGEIEV